MKTKKTFDCVEMKDEIQRKLLSKWQGMSDQEIIQQVRRDLNESNSPIAAWWRGLEHKQIEKAEETVATH